MSAGDSKRP